MTGVSRSGDTERQSRSFVDGKIATGKALFVITVSSLIIHGQRLIATLTIACPRMEAHLKKYIGGSLPSVKARIVTGIILVVLITSFVFSGEWTFLLLMLVINHLALMEYIRMVEIHGLNLQKVPMAITAFLLVTAAFFIGRQHMEIPVLTLLPAVISLLMIFELFRKQKLPVENVALSFWGIAWITVPFSLFVLISYLPFGSGRYHPLIIMGYFVILWLGDSGAYAAGKTIGRRKLFERISPKKTWEGSVGGLLLSWIAAVLNYFLFGQLALEQWLLLGLVIFITGSFGDFAKSMLKRSVGVKDSGTILPGHGGILDRFDTLIGSAPFAFLYILFYA